MNRTSNQTLRVATALAWEFWARCSRGVVTMIFSALLVPGIVCMALTWKNPGMSLRTGATGIGLQLGFFFPTILILAYALYPTTVNPKLRYALPASARLLVAAPMACAMAAMFASYALVAIMLNLLFDAGWLILIPAMVAAVGSAWLQAIMWSTSGSRALQFLAAVASILIVSAVAAHWTPPTSRELDVYLRNLDGRQFSLLGASLVLATTACAGVGTAGFYRRRQGAGFDVKRIVDWLSEWFYSWWGSRQARFSSPTTAQCWLEWTERGFALPFVTALLGIGTIFLAGFVPMRSGEVDAGAFVALASIFGGTPLLVIGFYWGCRSTTFEFRNFGGSRPLSDRQLAGAVLKSSTISFLVSVAIWAILTSVVFGIATQRQGPSVLHREFKQIGSTELLARAGLIVLALWSAVGLATSIALAGRRLMNIAIGLVCSGYFMSILLSLYFRQPFPHQLLLAYLSVCLILCLFATVAAFLASWRRRLIGFRTLGLVVLMLCAAVATAHLSGLLRGVPVSVRILVCCGLLPAPLAAAPLAVYFNRHR